MDAAIQPDGKHGIAPSVPDFRALFDALPGLYLVLLPDEPRYTIVAVNSAYAQATSIQPDEIIGRGVFDVFPDNPDDPHAKGVQNIGASLQRVLATKASDTMAPQKFNIRRPDSSADGFEERYWSPVNSPVLDSTGTVQYIIHHVQEITDFVPLKQLKAEPERRQASQVEAEPERRPVSQIEAELSLRTRELAQVKQLMEQRQRAEEELRESEGRFSAAFAEAPIGMVLTDPYGRILDINQAFLDMLGYTREEITSSDSAPFTHPEDMNGRGRSIRF